jgi:hypothetical protein
MNNIITQKVFKESNIIIFNNFYKFDVVHEIKLHFIT